MEPLPTANGSANSTLAAYAYSNWYVAIRAVTIPVSVAGLLLSSLSLTLLIRKYLRNREVFDVGLIIFQLAHVNYCLAISGYIPLDLALILTEQTRQAGSAANILFDVNFCWVSSSLAVKNMWTACVSVFRCLATFQPIRFRRWLTRRFQLCSFFVLLLTSAAIGIGTFVAWRLAARDSEWFLVRVMLPLLRAPQTYLPVPLILLTSCVTAALLVIAGRNRPSEAAAVATANANPNAAAVVAAEARSWRSATRIVLVLAASFIVFELPGAVFVTFELYRFFPDWLVPVNDLLVTVDSATSFFVFYIFSTNFRRLVCQLINEPGAPGRQEREATVSPRSSTIDRRRFRSTSTGASISSSSSGGGGSSRKRLLGPRVSAESSRQPTTSPRQIFTMRQPK